MSRQLARLFAALVLCALAAPCGVPAQAGRLLRVDTAQAAAVLDMLEGLDAGRQPAPAEWARLFATEGYVRLGERERGMRRAFTDSAFMAFVLSDTLRARTAALRQALTEWSAANLDSAAAHARAYLPEGAELAATIYIVVKPQTNSFVWDLSTNPAVFLYLDPAVPALKLENTIAHELHHIGLGANDARRDSLIDAMPDSVQLAAGWMGALSEGFAMLAAAGGPDVHPHAVSAEEERRRWDQDVARFNEDLGKLDAFFLDIIAGRFPSEDSVRNVAVTFYGIQGPWYTVGWRMAAEIERQLGRPELIQCLPDPRRLLLSYNRAARLHRQSAGDTLATWSPALVAALRGRSDRQ